MPIYYLKFSVAPTDGNSHVGIVAGALASCWIEAGSSHAAVAKARFYVRRAAWAVLAEEMAPIQVTAGDFQDRDIGLQQFNKARETGAALAFVAWAADGKTTSGPEKLEPFDDFDLNTFLANQRRLRQKGRCLHHQSGSRCLEVIDAHSIQKGGALSVIASDGHVYAFSRNFEDVKRHRGAPSFIKHGINKVSTFRGFCSDHDAQLFRLIDTAPLVPTAQQALLYAYRSICRELFVKENAQSLLEKQARSWPSKSAVGELLACLRQGTSFGVKNLIRHKRAYDACLKADSYSDVEYVAFLSSQPPTVAFSGLFYPDVDFLGNRLQDLVDHGTELDLLTFSFAPLTCGWAMLFAWHRDSASTCVPFLRSLATRIHGDERTLGDHLFRLVVSCCENMAISPKWWETLGPDAKQAVQRAAANGADIFEPLDPSYLAVGLEGISGWRFANVVSSFRSWQTEVAR